MYLSSLFVLLSYDRRPSYCSQLVIKNDVVDKYRSLISPPFVCFSTKKQAYLCFLVNLFLQYDYHLVAFLTACKFDSMPLSRLDLSAVFFQVVRVCIHVVITEWSICPPSVCLPPVLHVTSYQHNSSMYLIYSTSYQFRLTVNILSTKHTALPTHLAHTNLLPSILFIF